jgi:hypothetical protein
MQVTLVDTDACKWPRVMIWKRFGPFTPNTIAVTSTKYVHVTVSRVFWRCVSCVVSSIGHILARVFNFHIVACPQHLARYLIGRLSPEEALKNRQDTHYENPYTHDPEPYPDLLTNTRYVKKCRHENLL